MDEREQHAARIGYTSFQSVYGDVGPQKRNIVGRVNHQPHVWVEWIVGRSGCHVDVNPRDYRQMCVNKQHNCFFWLLVLN